MDGVVTFYKIETDGPMCRENIGPPRQKVFFVPPQ